MDWCATGSCTHIYFIMDFGFGVCVFKLLKYSIYTELDSPAPDIPATYTHDVTLKYKRENK